MSRTRVRSLEARHDLQRARPVGNRLDAADEAAFFDEKLAVTGSSKAQWHVLNNS